MHDRERANYNHERACGNAGYYIHASDGRGALQIKERFDFKRAHHSQ